MGLNLDMSCLRQKMETMNKRMAKQTLDKALESGGKVFQRWKKQSLLIQEN